MRADICPECGERLPKETLFDRYKRKHKCCPDCDTVRSIVPTAGNRSYEKRWDTKKLLKEE